MIQVDAVLSQLGFEFKIKGARAVMSCPFHTEKSPSFGIELAEPYRYHCFGCGVSGTIFSFYKKLTGNSLINDKDKASYTFQNALRPRVFAPVKEKKIHFFEGKKYPVRVSQEVTRWLENRMEGGVPIEFCEYFNIEFVVQAEVNRDIELYKTDKKEGKGTFFQDRIIIPIVEKGVLVGMEGRSYNGGKPKVLYPKQSRVDTLLNIDNLDRRLPLLLTEGTFDLPAIFKCGYRNISCLFGASIAQKQFDLLNEFEEIWYFPDNDVAGMNVLKNLDEKLRKEFYVCFLPKHRKDPGECNPRDIQWAIRNKKLYVDYLYEKINPPKPTPLW